MHEYRVPDESDFPVLQALDRAAQVAYFDELPEREREGRLCTSLPALKFYARTGHSFVAARGGEVRGFALAQSVWQGDRPLVLVRAVVSSDPEAVAGLLHAVVKSAYDTAVYEVHVPVSPELMAAATTEGAYVLGQYGVIHLGTRSETAAGQRLKGDQ